MQRQESVNPQEQFKSYIFNFLRTNEDAQNAIKSAVIPPELSTGQLTRIFNSLDATDAESFRDFVLSYNEAIKDGKFEEWTHYKTSKLLHLLLDENGRLRNEIIDLFANSTGQNPQDVLRNLYDDPEKKEKVEKIQDLITTACLLGVSVVFGDASKKAREDPSPEFRKLTEQMHFVTNMIGDEVILDDRATFKTISKESYSEFKDKVRRLDPAMIANIELQVIKIQTLYQQNKIINLNKLRDKVHAAHGVGNVLFSVDAKIKKRKEKIENLEDKGRKLVAIIAERRPKPAAIVEAFNQKLRLYEKLNIMLSKEGESLKEHTEEIVALRGMLANNLETSMTDDKQFAHYCSQLDEVLLNRLSVLITKNPQVNADYFFKTYQELNHKFYNACRRAKDPVEVNVALQKLKSALLVPENLLSSRSRSQPQM